MWTFFSKELPQPGQLVVIKFSIRGQGFYTGYWLEDIDFKRIASDANAMWIGIIPPPKLNA